MKKYFSLEEHIVNAIWTSLRDRSGFDFDIDSATEAEILEELAELVKKESELFLLY